MKNVLHFIPDKSIMSRCEKMTERNEITTMKRNVQNFIQQETILAVAIILAAVSCFFVHPDKEYISYIDWRTMALLYCLMAVMAGVKELGVFRHVGEALLKRTGSQQGVTSVLVALCFLSSMLITNDVALITFVPFGMMVLKMADMDDSVCLTVTLMTIAANLGSMLTPIGNPQNLYLYSASGLTIFGFVRIMLPYTMTAAVCLGVLVMCGYRRTATVSYAPKREVPPVHIGKGVLYAVLFVLCLACVLEMIRAEILLVIVTVCVFLENSSLLRKVDYGLLATFLAFFVFIGNVGRLPVLNTLMSHLVSGHEEIVSIVASQVISNVPAALLLSGFSQHWSRLIIGTNLGGLGTLIASMASLISYKQIAKQYPEKKMKYLLVFTAWNFAFLAVLWMAGSVF